MSPSLPPEMFYMTVKKQMPLIDFLNINYWTERQGQVCCLIPIISALKELMQVNCF